MGILLTFENHRDLSRLRILVRIFTVMYGNSILVKFDRTIFVVSWTVSDAPVEGNTSLVQWIWINTSSVDQLVHQRHSHNRAVTKQFSQCCTQAKPWAL